MKFRYIKIRTFSAAMNMALDEAISEGVRDGTTPPTIRLYTWTPSAVSIGYFQGLHNEVDTKACEELGVDVVRRQTGGGAVYHDSDGEITYSIIAPEKMFSSDIIKSYEEIVDFVIDALNKITVPAKFSPINDIISNDRKISGNAQTRRRGVLIQHGTILYMVDVDTMFSLLTVSDQKIIDKLIHSVKKFIIYIIE